MDGQNIPVTKTKHPKKAKKRVAKISRWLHIYLSMVSFVIVLFFSVTGLTLNHAEKFQGKAYTTQDKGKLNATWINNKDTNLIRKLNVVEYLRNTHKVKGAVSDFRIDETQLSVAFRGPGYEADAFINRTTGEYELSQTRTGFVGFMNDLHKGRDTGTAWSWIIDISAILLILISATGLVLLLFLKKKRRNGLLLAALGFGVIYIIYKIFGN